VIIGDAVDRRIVISDEGITFIYRHSSKVQDRSMSTNKVDTALAMKE
jgi:hypothetical protein